MLVECSLICSIELCVQEDNCLKPFLRSPSPMVHNHSDFSLASLALFKLAIMRFACSCMDLLSACQRAKKTLSSRIKIFELML